jgi:hypothetical protein
MSISLELTPTVTEVVVEGANVSVEVGQGTTTVVEASVAFPALSSTGITVTPYKTITSTILQTALEQLADQNFRGDTAPSGGNVQVGDTWYDTSTNIFYAYRTVAGITDWYPILNGDADSPDRLDGGAF